METTSPVKNPLVIIPTFNEIENIEAIIQAIYALPIAFDILVVDDNSPDGTAQVVTELQLKYPERLFLLVREEKKGLGAAYIHGFQWALQKNYAFICEMDADFSHAPSDLCRLYTEARDGKADVVIGSRYINGVNVVSWPLRRILLSRGASFYVRMLTQMPIKDPTAGFICYRKEVIEAINLDEILFVGYAFQVEMKYKAFLRGFRLLEIPIVFTDRIRGKSKMNGSIIKEGIWGVLVMRFRHLFKRE